jgi:hypothetical protein
MEGRGRGLIRGTIMQLSQRLRKTKKTSVRIADLRAEIQNRDHQNRK